MWFLYLDALRDALFKVQTFGACGRFYRDFINQLKFDGAGVREGWAFLQTATLVLWQSRWPLKRRVYYATLDYLDLRIGCVQFQRESAGLSLGGNSLGSCASADHVAGRNSLQV